METTVQKERRRIRLFSWTGAALIIGIVGALNLALNFFPIRMDASSGKVYSVSRGTKSLLKKLDDTVLVRVVFSSNLPPVYELNRRYLVDLLSEYRRASGGRIRVEFFDPGKTPESRNEAMEMGVAPVQLDIRERDRVEVKESFMGVSFRYLDRQESIPVVQDTQGLEYEITLRIKRLINPAKSQLALASNGEAHTLESEALSQLAPALRQVYDIVTVDLTQPVPTGNKAVWLIGGKAPVDPSVITNLKAFLAAGGAVGLLLDRYAVEVRQFRATAQNHGLDPLLQEFGIRQRDGLVSDPISDRLQIRTMQGSFQMINVIDYPYFPWITDIDRTHPATKSVDGFSLPFVAPFEITEQKAGLAYAPLARSSPRSFLDASPSFLNPLNPPARTASSLDGPFDVALLVQGKFTPDAAQEGRLILFGTSHFVDSAFPLRPTNYGMLINLMDWSLQEDDLLQIRAKGAARRPLREMPDAARMLIKYAMIFGLPVFSLTLGLVVWRRHKTRLALLPLRYAESS